MMIIQTTNNTISHREISVQLPFGCWLLVYSWVVSPLKLQINLRLLGNEQINGVCGNQ